MKISIARASERYPRHIKVVLPLSEDWGRRMMLQRIVGRDVQLERHQETMLEASQKGRSECLVVYRLALGYLDDLLLAFPMADMSASLSKRVIRQARDEIRNTPVPDLNLRGFQMYDRAGRKVDLFDFQKIVVGMGIDALLGKRGIPGQKSVHDQTQVLGFFNNLEMGLGKTAIAEATLVALHRNLIKRRKKRGEKDVRSISILIVIPNNAKTAWKRALDANTHLDAVIVEGTQAQRERLIAERHDVTIVNFETIRCTWDKSAGRRRERWVAVPKHPSLFDHEYYAVVCDEYHRVKNPEAQQSIGYLHLRSTRHMPMSGTPILSKPEEAWVTLHRVWPNLFPDYESFCRALIQKDGGEILGYNPEVMVELKKFLSQNSVRIRKDQVMDQLPEELYVRKDVELTREQRKIYNTIRDEMLLMLENGDVRDIMSPLAMITRLKQAAFSPELFEGSRHSAKIDELREDVAQLVDSGEKAILGSQWSTATRILQREFAHYNPAYVDGTVVDTRTRKARTDEVDRFNNDDDCRLYIGTIGANKEAITLHAATYVAMTDKDWTPSNNRQFVMRSAAGGLRGLGSGVSSVTILEYIAKDTIEEAIEEMLLHKQNIFNAVVEKDGGFRAKRSVFKDIMTLLRKA